MFRRIWDNSAVKISFYKRRVGEKRKCVVQTTAITSNISANVFCEVSISKGRSDRHSENTPYIVIFKRNAQNTGWCEVQHDRIPKVTLGNEIL